MKPTTYLVGGPAHGMPVPLDNNSLDVEIVDEERNRRRYRRTRYFRIDERGKPVGEIYVVFVYEGGFDGRQIAETLDRIDRDPLQRKDDGG